MPDSQTPESAETPFNFPRDWSSESLAAWLRMVTFFDLPGQPVPLSRDHQRVLAELERRELESAKATTATKAGQRL